MNLFSVLTVIYYGFFAGLFVLAFKVFSNLRALANKISDLEAGDVKNITDFKNADSFLLYSSPNFPLAALIKILPGTFVGFGILGTFLGFSNGIAGMKLTENVDELFGKLDVFFTGLNTAFITSIVGVVLSVLFGTLLYQWPLNKIKFHCSRIYENYVNAFNPKESAEEEFRTYIDSVSKMTESLLVAKQSIETLPEKFTEVGINLEKSIAPVKETFATMQSILENYSEQAKSLQNASEQIQTTLSTFIEKSKQTTTIINDSLEKAIEVTTRIQDNNAKSLQNTSEQIQATLSGFVEKVEQSINSSLEKSVEVTTQIQENNAKSLQNASEQIQTTLSSFVEKSEQTITTVNGSLEKAIEVTTQIQENNRKLIEETISEQKNALVGYKEIDEKISSILESVNDNLTQYSQTMEKTLVQTLEEYNKTAQKVTEAFFGDKK